MKSSLTGKVKYVLGSLVLSVPMGIGVLILAPAADAANLLSVSVPCSSECTAYYVCRYSTSYSSQGITVTGSKVDNTCDVRVWLNQNPDGSGYGLCLDPKTKTGALGRPYDRIYVSANKSNCP